MTFRGAGGYGPRGGMGRVMRTASQDPPAVRKGQTGATARRIAGFFRPYRLQVVVVLFTIILTSLLGLVNPLVLKQLIDVALPGAELVRCSPVTCC